MAWDRSKLGNSVLVPIVFKHRDKMCQALFSDLLVGALFS